MDGLLSPSVENSPVRDHVIASTVSVTRPDDIGMELAPVDAANGLNGDNSNGYAHDAGSGNGDYVTVGSSPADGDENI